MHKYTITSVLDSPDAWLFTETGCSKTSEELEFTSPEEHGKTLHLVKYSCEAETLNQAWQKFHQVVVSFINAAAFYTSSYISFWDWKYIVINETKNISIISLFQRTLGTSLSLYSENETASVQLLIDQAKKDQRLANFLHCYRMAILVDAPETYDAYEKYLIVACEALAGEVETEERTSKYDRKRLELIIGKDLHKTFFSRVDQGSGKTVRNAHFHIGKVMENEGKPRAAIRLVNKLREFIAKEYGATGLPIIEIQNSPTRGKFRDDGGLVVVKGAYSNSGILMENNEPNAIFHTLVDDPSFEILSGESASEAVNSL